jgi:hypothetical protein
MISVTPGNRQRRQAGEFVMGDDRGVADEYPPDRVSIDRPYHYNPRDSRDNGSAGEKKEEGGPRRFVVRSLTE